MEIPLYELEPFLLSDSEDRFETLLASPYTGVELIVSGLPHNTPEAATGRGTSLRGYSRKE
jgi:hypothetical protein